MVVTVVCSVFVRVMLLCVFGYEVGRVCQKCWRCVMFMLVYCQWLCGCTCVISMKLIHCTYSWLLDVRC